MKPIETFETPSAARVNYINAQYGLKSWLLTKDHKRIALVYLSAGRDHYHLRVARRRRGYGLDILCPLQHHLFQLLRNSGWSGNLHQRLLVDPDGAELHRNYPHDAGPGNDLVPAPALHLGPLCHVAGYDSGHSGHSNHHSA